MFVTHVKLIYGSPTYASNILVYVLLGSRTKKREMLLTLNYRTVYFFL